MQSLPLEAEYSLVVDCSDSVGPARSRQNAFSLWDRTARLAEQRAPAIAILLSSSLCLAVLSTPVVPMRNGQAIWHDMYDGATLNQTDSPSDRPCNRVSCGSPLRIRARDADVPRLRSYFCSRAGVDRQLRPCRILSPYSAELLTRYNDRIRSPVFQIQCAGRTQRRYRKLLNHRAGYDRRRLADLVARADPEWKARSPS